MQKPLGRTLKEFIRPDGSLPPAEQKLLQAAGAGVECHLGAERPQTWDPSNAVRAGFLRFLLLGGGEGAAIHEKGVQVCGAWVEDLLDLDECQLECSLQLRHCVVDRGIRLTDATLINFALLGCTILPIAGDNLDPPRGDWAIFGDRVKASNAVLIREGTIVHGLLRLQGARLSGDLDLSGGTFLAGSDGVSIDLIGLHAGGDLELNNYYRGELPKVDDDRDRTHIEYHFFANGRVLLDNAEVNMRFRMIGPTILFAADDDAPAVSCIGMVVKGGFFLHNQARIAGVALLGAKVGTLVDELSSWQSGWGRHQFDGFVYDRIADESRGISRVKWLATQHPKVLGKVRPFRLRRQPFEQAAKALEAIGDVKAAKKMRIEVERKETAISDFWRLLWRSAWDLLDGYGYVTGRLAIVTVIIWLGSAFVVDSLARQGGFSAVTSDTRVRDAGDACMQAMQTLEHAPFSFDQFVSGFCTDLKRPDHPDHPPIYPLLYSADNLVPVLDLGQKKSWRWTSHSPLSWLMIAESIYGYLAASTLLAVFGSYIVRKTA